MSDPIVVVEQVPVDWIDVTRIEDDYPRRIPGTFQVELRLVEMPWTLEEAQRHLREGTRFRLLGDTDE